MGIIQLHRRKGRDTIIGTAGEDLIKYDLVYLKSGTWWKADRDALASMPAVGMCTGAVSAGDSNYILLWGIIGNPDWAWVDGAIYASATPGGLTQIAPTTSGYAQAVAVSYGVTFLLFTSTWVKQIDETRVHIKHVPAAAFGKNKTDPPTVVIVGNTKLLEFEVNADKVHYKWMTGEHYVPGTDLVFKFHWTNDGGVDDNGKNIKIQLSYLPVCCDDVVSGDHANSPRTIDDTYTSDLGSVFHTTGELTIPAADFLGKHEVEMMFMFITADATVLTGKPRLDSMHISYTEYVYR